MFYLVNFLSILNYSIFLTFILKRNISKMFPVSMILMSLIVYISGVFLNFKIGIYILIILSVIFLFYNCYNIFFMKKDLKEYIDAGVIVFMVIYFLSILIFNKRMLSVWDEFSHWGLVVKNMYLINDFANINNSTIRFITYPPIVGIWEYIYAFPFRVFDEANLLIAYFILLFSFCIGSVNFSKKSKMIKNVGLVFLFFLIPIIFNKEVYVSLYVDFLLGIIGAYIIIVYDSYEKKDWRLWVELFLLLSFIVLIKATGLPIALFCIIFFILDGIKTKNIKESVKISIFSLVVTLFFSLSWSYIIKLSGYVKPINNNSIFARITTMFKEGNLNTDYQILQSFIEGFFNLKINIEGLSITTFTFFIIIIIIFILSFIKKENHIRFISGYVFFVVAIYTISLYITYLTNFDPAESLKLASYGRYFSTIAIFSTWLLVYYFFENKRNKILSCFVIIMILSVTNYQTLKYLTFGSYKKTKKIKIMREAYKFNNIPIKLTKNEKIFFISQNKELHDGYDYWIALYSLTPAHIQDIYTTSLGLPYSELDGFSRNINKEEWVEILRSYDYVYLHTIDERFINDYGSLFEEAVKPDSLYKINKDNVLKLTIIE